MTEHADTRDFEQLIHDYWKNSNPRFKVILISSFLWAIIAHGMALFNEYARHDALTYLFRVGETYASGRWFLGILADFLAAFMDSPHFGMPLFNGLLSVLFISLSVFLIAQLFNFRHTGACIVLSGIWVAFPSVTATFSYIFTAPYYMFAVFLATAGAFLICRYQKWHAFLLGSLLIGLSLGIYQAYLPISLSILLLSLIQNIVTSDEWNWKSFLCKALYFGAGCILAVLLYSLLGKILLYWTNQSLSPYMGISNMGQEGLRNYYIRAKYIYQIMLSPVYMRERSVESMSAMFPQRTVTLYMITMAASILLSLYHAFCLFQKDKGRAVCLLMAVILLPLANNFIFVMCDPDISHALMGYGQAMIFVYLIWLMEYTHFPSISLSRWVYASCLSLLLLVSFLYARYANAYYLQIDLEQHQAISYFTTMIAQIKNTEGYQDEYPVVFLNSGQISDASIHPMEAFDGFVLNPTYGYYRTINTVWLPFMYYWCGYSPQLGEPENFEALPEVEAMPHYPDQGSIRVLGDTVIVKF